MIGQLGGLLEQRTSLAEAAANYAQKKGLIVLAVLFGRAFSALWQPVEHCPPKPRTT